MRERANPRRSRGVSLVELLGVMLILSILAGGAVPALRGIDRAGAVGDREAAESSFGLASRLALASGVPHVVVVLADGTGVRVEREAFGGDPGGLARDASGQELVPVVLRYDPIVTVGGAAPSLSGTGVRFGAGGAPLEGETLGLAEEPLVVVFASGERLEIEAVTGGTSW